MTSGYRVDCGLIDYQPMWDIQHQLAKRRAVDDIPDTVLLLEHPHTYTLGRSGDRANLLMSEDDLNRQRVTVLDVDRGGDITYHGPGQLVAYPILQLGQTDENGRLVQADYVGYLRRLEDVIIQTIAQVGISGWREDGYTGVWVQDGEVSAKIAAIGVKVTARGVSLHGCALNVQPDLAFFSGIIPCGIVDRPVTSMARLLGDGCPSLSNVADTFATCFASVFGLTLSSHNVF